jgi:T5SS/PEP-CTERM-associated repeat protein
MHVHHGLRGETTRIGLEFSASVVVGKRAVRSGCKFRFVVSGRAEAARVMETKQHRSSISREVLIALGFFFILTAPLRAQYTADYQTNIISGVTSNWMGSYLVGSNTFADVLLIQNAGVLSNRTGYLGYEASSSNNSVVVAGLGSIWGQPLDLYDEGFYVFIGYSGPGNSLVISNGGLVQCGHMYGSYLGYNSSSSNNTMLVTGTGSVWSNGGLFVGYSGGGNSLIISNGGQVVGAGYIGNNPSSGDNNVVVTGSGSLWRIGCLGGPVSCYWPIGGYGSTNNRVVISDGGSIVTFDIILGGTSNALVVSGGSLLCYPTHLEYPHNVLVGVNDNSIVISNGGEFSSQQFYLESTNNIVLVTGPGYSVY